jgi:hypothetical protein
MKLGFIVLCFVSLAYSVRYEFWTFCSQVLEVFCLLVLSLRNYVLLFGVVFLFLVLLISSYDLLYFMFVYAGGLMVLNFLIFTGDLGSLPVYVFLSPTQT